MRTHDGLVTVFLGHLEQLGVVGQLLRQPVNDQHPVFKRFFLAAEFLRPLGLVPDVRVLERGVDFVQFSGFGRVVKDTPVTLGSWRSGP